MYATIRKYLQVIKPGLVLGNLVAVLGGFLLAARGNVEAALLLATAAGTSLVVASGCVFNNCIDRHIDRKMVRTKHRAMATGSMSPKVATVYATILGSGGALLLWLRTNLLCVTIVTIGFAIYVAAYSLWLKRTSVYSTMIGSLAGAAPPLVGYCAVTNRFDLGAGILLSIFSLWQMPHSYAVAVFRLKDYTAAAIPVLPVRHDISIVKKQILGYIIAFTAASSLLTFSGYTGYSYLTVTTIMGIFWLGLACSGNKAPDKRWARRLFIFSIASIMELSCMMAIDVCILTDDTHLPTSPRSTQIECSPDPIDGPLTTAKILPVPFRKMLACYCVKTPRLPSI